MKKKLQKIISSVLLMATVIGSAITVSAAQYSAYPLINELEYDSFNTTKINGNTVKWVKTEEVPCDEKLVLSWDKCKGADSYAYCVKVLDGKPSPSASESGEVIVNFSTVSTTKITIPSSKMEKCAGRWLKVFVEGLSSYDPTFCTYHTYYYIPVSKAVHTPELLDKAPSITSPENVTGYSFIRNSLISYATASFEINPEEATTLQWKNCNTDRYDVHIKVLNGSPEPKSNNEKGTLIYSGYKGTNSYKLKAGVLKGYAGKWLKVSVQGLDDNDDYTYQHITYFMIASKSSASSSSSSTSTSSAVNFKVSASSITFGPIADTYTVNVSGVDKYTVSENASWISYTKSGNSLKLKVAANKTDTVREAVVTVSASGNKKTIRVIQTRAFLEADRTRVECGREAAGTGYITVNSSSDWYISSYTNWITLNVQKNVRYTTGKSFVITPYENTTGRERTGKVVIKNDTGSLTIYVTQSSVPNSTTVTTLKPINSSTQQSSSADNKYKYADYTGWDYQASLDWYRLINYISGETEYQNRLAILQEAEKYCTILWTSPVSFNTWRSSAGSLNSNVNMRYDASEFSASSSSTQFISGKTYVGMPYSMYCVDSKSGNKTTLDEFMNSITTISDRSFYEGNAQGGRTTCDIYGIDCAGLVMNSYKSLSGYCQGYVTTRDMSNAAYFTAKNYNELKPGDVLCTSKGHMIIYIDRLVINNEPYIACFESVADGLNGYAGCRYHEYREKDLIKNEYVGYAYKYIANPSGGSKK